MRSISKISAALDKLESRIPDPAATKCVWIIVDNGDGPRTVEGEQARHLAEHPSDVGCNWIIWRIMRPGNSREYLAREEENLPTVASAQTGAKTVFALGENRADCQLHLEE